MPKIVDIAEHTGDYQVAVRSHTAMWETIRENVRFFTAIILIVAIFFTLLWVLLFGPACSDKVISGCYSATDRQWVQTILNTLIGALIGTALIAPSRDESRR